MREIKFRAWEKSLKEMIPVNDITFHLENNVINSKGAWRLLDELELMQYTGLKDKNGVEIYEGDVVVQGKLTGPVEWSVSGFRVRQRQNEQPLGNYGQPNVEIIGNIYENSDLLEDTAK